MRTRRGFLRATLGSCWTSAALLEQSIFRATQARAQATPDLAALFNIQKIADGAYAAIAKPATVLNCNAAIFENSKDLLIVDTHSKPSAVVALVAQINREITKKPVRYVVNSHFHWDHSQGSPAYRKMNPQAHVVSSEVTRQLLSENGAQRLKESLEQMRARLQQTEEQRGRAKDATEIRTLATQADDIKKYIAEMQNYTPELPDLTFDRELVLHDKDQDLHLFFRGRAHTAGDVVVLSPKNKVVATGDMIHSLIPFIGDGYPKEWPRTIRSVAELSFDHVIGGHGQVQGGKTNLQGMAAYIEELTTAVERDRQKPLSELQASITPATLKSLAGDYGRFVMQNLSGSDPAKALANGVRTNIGHIHNRLSVA